MAWEKEHGTADQNPKDIQGKRKPPLHLIPPVANIVEAMVLKYGADKYQPFNWRTGPQISLMEYIGAIERHIAQLKDGEDVDQESLLLHIGHVRATTGIILDADSLGQLNDDRPAAGMACEYMDEYTIRPEPQDEIGDLIEVDDESELVPAMGVSRAIFEGRDMPEDPDRYARGTEAPHAFVEQQPRFGEVHPMPIIQELPPVAKPILGPTEKQRIRTELMGIFEQFDNGFDGDGIQHIKRLAEQLK